MVDDFDAWYVELRAAMGPALAAWCGDASLAADALDEAFVRACERWERVRSTDSPAGWVWQTATNVVRRRARRATFERSATDSRPPTATRSEDAVAADLDLRAALARLTDRQRTAIVLHHIADLPQREVAAAMGIAEGTVAATVHQARARLAELLALEPDPDQPAARQPDPDGAHQ